MITPRRNTERLHVHRDLHDIWFTFPADERRALPAAGFEKLTALNEIRFSPGGGPAPSLPGETEIITYVYRGVLAQEDSTGRSGVVHAGEFQRMTTGPGIRQKEKNASRTHCAHVFRISLCALEIGLGGTRKEKRFVAAERHNQLCVVASPDGRKGSLRILQDAFIYSCVLDPGHHVVHELLLGRCAWLHIIYGEATLPDLLLTPGDGAGVAHEPSVSITAQENTEMLLIDLGPPAGFSAGGGGA